MNVNPRGLLSCPFVVSRWPPGVESQGVATFCTTITDMGRYPDGANPRGMPISFRPTDPERAAIERQRADRGGMSQSAYIRWLIAQDGKKIAREKGRS